VKNDTHLQKGHPLTHLVTSFRSIQQHSTENLIGKTATLASKGPYSEQPVLVELLKKKKKQNATGAQKYHHGMSKSSKLHREFLMSTHIPVSIRATKIIKIIPRQVGGSSTTSFHAECTESMGTASSTQSRSGIT